MLTTFKSVNLYDARFIFIRKRFELLGIVPIGTFCYICGDGANHEFNNHKVCDFCFNTLKAANKESHVYDTIRYYSAGNNEWYPEHFLTHKYTYPYYSSYYLKTINFKTKCPEKMLQFAFNCTNKTQSLENNLIKCFNCTNPTYTEICDKCENSAIIYFFELYIHHYLCLKEMFSLAIAKHTILHYLEIKLNTCRTDC
jgi:hypothetical protein